MTICQSTIDRFWSKVNKYGPVPAHAEHLGRCWIWTTCRTDFGYGRIGMGGRGGRTERAHRLSWMIHNGPVPDGLCVLHLCDNPPCCNPDHLHCGTRGLNAEEARMRNRFARGDRHYLRRNPERVQGERNPQAKLTVDLVEQAKKRHAEGESHESIARSLGVTRRTIGRAVTGQAWGHVIHSGGNNE